jgi:hypothetical protein
LFALIHAAIAAAVADAAVADCFYDVVVPGWDMAAEKRPDAACGSDDHTGCRAVQNSVLRSLFVIAVPPCRYLRLDEAAAVSDLGVDFDRDAVTAEMQAGDVLLFNNLIPHR